jgi:UDP-N-acetylmuramate--alanine ligase
VAEWPEGPEALETVSPGLTLLLKVGGDPWLDHDSWKPLCREYLGAIPLDGQVLALGHPALVENETRWPRVSTDPHRFSWLSFQRGSDWWGADLRADSGRYWFRVFHRGRFVCELALRVPGRHNALSALAAVAACDRLGLSTEEVRGGLEEFEGLSRDFELRGSFRGVTLVDDASEDAGSVHYALSLSRRTFGLRRLWVVFAAPEALEPADVSRLVAAFATADRVVVTPGVGVAGVRHGAEWPDRGRACRALARGLDASGVPARCEADLAAAVTELDRSLEPGDVLLTLGAGDVGTIADAFIRRLPRDRQGG